MTAPEVRTPGGNRASAEDTKADAVHFDSEHDNVLRDPDRQFKDYRAKLALKGHELYQLDGGRFLVRRWGLCRDLRDLAAVEDFARMVGVTL